MHNNIYEDFIRAFCKLTIVSRKYNYLTCMVSLKDAYKVGVITEDEFKRAKELRLKNNEIKFTDKTLLITREDVEFINELCIRLDKYFETSELTEGGRQ